VAYAIEFECEYDHVIDPSVNMIVMIEPNCEKNILEFKLISSARNYPKFNMSPPPHLKSKNHKIASKKFHFSRAFQYTKISPQFS
jgi:hypothetical protein